MLALSFNSESLCDGEAELLAPGQLCPAHPALGSPLSRGSCFTPIPGRQAGPDLAECPSSGWSHAFLPGFYRAPWELSMYH